MADVVAEFKRLTGYTRLDLDQVGETMRWGFLGALLETEPNRLGTGFRKNLFEHTGGHALFTVELLRAMQERGDLVRDEAGQWVSAPELDWETLPPRVEGVVEGRLSRLDEDSHRILAAASVEGDEFTVQVLAGVLGMAEEELLQLLSHSLRMHHRLVQELGAAVVGDRRLFRYRFVHSLFRQYLYHSLGDGERVMLHRKTAGMLEELYEGRTEEIAFTLAYHYAGDPVRERHYAMLAGERAAAQFANQEALRYLNRALELTPRADAETRFSLLMTREGVHDTLGDREAQKQDLASLEKLDGVFGDEGPAAALRSANVSLRQARYAHTCGLYPTAIAASQAALRLARAAQAPDTMADAHLQWGRALGFLGQYQAARLRLEEGLELARHAGSRQVEAATLHNIGVVHYVQSEYDQAGACIEQAIAIFRELGERQHVVILLNNAGILDLDRFDYGASARQLHEALQHAREIGFRLVESIVLGNLGDCLVATGDVATARLRQEQALRIARDTGAQPYVAGALRGLSHAVRLSGDLQAALHYSQQAVAIIQEIGNRFFEEQALTCLGHALLGLERWAEASEAHRAALLIRQELGQRNRPVENLSALAEAHMGQGEAAQALELVERILAHLANHTLEGCWEPARIYLTCYRVLKDQADPRAVDVLRAAYSFVMELAGRFQDEERKRSFLENVAIHRAIVREWRLSGVPTAN